MASGVRDGAVLFLPCGGHNVQLILVKPNQKKPESPVDGRTELGQARGTHVLQVKDASRDAREKVVMVLLLL